VAHKQAAIEQWTADPCGASIADGEPGSRSYFDSLLAGRRQYAPWMDTALDYEGAAGLDVLDVGCGQGIDVARYALAGARPTGVDLTPRHVELARTHAAALDLGARIEHGDAEALPFDDAVFDRVSSNGVLHHTPHMAAALSEIRRVLRPGGEARVIVYNRNSLHYWINQVAFHGVLRRGLLEERSMAGVLSRTVEYSTIGARPLVRVYTPASARTLMRAAGLTEVTSEVHHFHAGDTVVTELLSKRLRRLRDPRTLERIGRRAGWYVMIRGRRSA